MYSINLYHNIALTVVNVGVRFATG